MHGRPEEGRGTQHQQQQQQQLRGSSVWSAVVNDWQYQTVVVAAANSDQFFLSFASKNSARDAKSPSRPNHTVQSRPAAVYLAEHTLGARNRCYCVPYPFNIQHSGRPNTRSGRHRRGGGERAPRPAPRLVGAARVRGLSDSADYWLNGIARSAEAGGQPVVRQSV